MRVAILAGKTGSKGRIKEAAGVLTGNDKLRAKGNADQTLGEVKQVADKAVDKVKKVVKKTARLKLVAASELDQAPVRAATKPGFV